MLNKVKRITKRKNNGKRKWRETKLTPKNRPKNEIQTNADFIYPVGICLMLENCDMALTFPKYKLTKYCGVFQYVYKWILAMNCCFSLSICSVCVLNFSSFFSMVFSLLFRYYCLHVNRLFVLTPYCVSTEIALFWQIAKNQKRNTGTYIHNIIETYSLTIWIEKNI